MEGMDMKYETLKHIITAKQKGSFSHLIWEKQLPVRKAFNGVTVVKRTQGTVRAGVTYDNMGAVQTKRETGILPSENAGLTWGTWSEFPFFISYKGAQYLRVSLDRNNKLESEYYINGVKASKEQAQMYCTKAAFPDGAKPDVLTIKVDNIISIR
jgi:hypothetical protein